MEELTAWVRILLGNEHMQMERFPICHTTLSLSSLKAFNISHCPSQKALLIQLRFPVTFAPFHSIWPGIVPGEMLNTFAAKWTSWAIEIKWVMRVFHRTKAGAGSREPGAGSQPGQGGGLYSGGAFNSEGRPPQRTIFIRWVGLLKQ